MDFNEKLVAMRKGLGINQQELADLIGVSIDSVRRWEAGKQEPRLSDLKALAAVLGSTIDELSGEDNLSEEKTQLFLQRKLERKAENGKTGKIVLQHGQLKLEIPADDRGYAFLNSKLKEFTVNDNLTATVIEDK